MLYVDLSQHNYLPHERNITGHYMGLFYLRMSVTCISDNIHTITQKDFSSNILDPPAGRTVSLISPQVYRLLYGFTLFKHPY